jgi:hypothetical protein
MVTIITEENTTAIIRIEVFKGRGTSVLEMGAVLSSEKL